MITWQESSPKSFSRFYSKCSLVSQQLLERTAQLTATIYRLKPFSNSHYKHNLKIANASRPPVTVSTSIAYSYLLWRSHSLFPVLLGFLYRFGIANTSSRAARTHLHQPTPCAFRAHSRKELQLGRGSHSDNNTIGVRTTRSLPKIKPVCRKSADHQNNAQTTHLSTQLTSPLL